MMLGSEMAKKVVSRGLAHKAQGTFEGLCERHATQPRRALHTAVAACEALERLTEPLEGGGAPLGPLPEFARLARGIGTVLRLDGELATAATVLAGGF
jgi:hypothetical protein